MSKGSRYLGTFLPSERTNITDVVRNNVLHSQHFSSIFLLSIHPHMRTRGIVMQYVSNDR